MNRRLADDVLLIGQVEEVEILGVCPMREHLTVHIRAQAAGELVIGEESPASTNPPDG